jgi:hypothetical protein
MDRKKVVVIDAMGFPWFSLVPEQLVHKFHVALHTSHAALPMATLNISPCTNVTLTLGCITLFMGDMGEGDLHREDEVTVKQRN